MGLKIKKLDKGDYEIRHIQVYVPDRGHRVDELILPVLEMLWDNGIRTFYSCQGGVIEIRNRKMVIARAYVVVLEKDTKKACDLLAHRHPKVDKDRKRFHMDRTAIRFDPIKREG